MLYFGAFASTEAETSALLLSIFPMTNLANQLLKDH